MQNYISMIANNIENMKNSAISGDLQPHEALAIIKESSLEEVLKEAISEIKSIAIDNLRNNFLNQNEKTYNDGSFSYTVREGSTRYYFTDVEEVKEAKFQAEKTEEFKRFKATESKYKTAFLMKQKNQVLVDEETGEIVDPSDVKVVYNPDSLSIKRKVKEVA